MANKKNVLHSILMRLQVGDPKIRAESVFDSIRSIAEKMPPAESAGLYEATAEVLTDVLQEAIAMYLLQ